MLARYFGLHPICQKRYTNTVTIIVAEKRLISVYRLVLDAKPDRGML